MPKVFNKAPRLLHVDGPAIQPGAEGEVSDAFLETALGKALVQDGSLVLGGQAAAEEADKPKAPAKPPAKG